MMTFEEFVDKWMRSSRPEEAASKEHFLNICSVVSHPQPVDVDPHANHYALEKRACISSKRYGFADAWKRDFFVWEYKTKQHDLDRAYSQALQYRPPLGNPPLTVVSDMKIIRVYTEFTNTRQHVYEFDLYQLKSNDLSNSNRGLKARDILYAVFHGPEALRPETPALELFSSVEYKTWMSQQELKNAIAFSLPVQPAHQIVDRDNLLQQAKNLLFSGSRVVFVGMPGVGKTALAAKLIIDSQVRSHFFNGVLWIRLGRNIDTIAKLEEIATKVGVPSQRLTAAISLDDRSLAAHQAAALIHESIGERRFLLVLDDVWKTTDALYFKLGARCGHVVTTRLSTTAGEFGGMNVHVPELTQDAALKLLREVAPDSVHSEKEKIHQLIAAVGGLPLALIIIARHLQSTSGRGQSRRLTDALERVYDAKARLREKMKLAPAEQHPSLSEAEISLMASINVSFEALPLPARNVLIGLSSFAPKPADFAEDAIVTVAASEQDSNALDTLVDFGLIECYNDRYTIHQVISDYAREKANESRSGSAILILRDVESFLSSSGEINAAIDGRLLHAIYYLRLLDITHGSWPDIRPEWPQILHAWDRAVEQNDEELLIHYVAKARRTLKTRGFWAALREWLDRSICAAISLGRVGDAGTLLVDSGWLFSRTGNPTAAAQQYEQALDIHVRKGNLSAQGYIHNHLGLFYADHGDYSRAAVHCQEALSIGDVVNDQRIVAGARNNFGIIWNARSEFDASLHNLLEALGIFQILGDNEGEAHALSNIAGVYFRTGQLDLALKFGQQALRIHEASGNVAEIALCLNNLSTYASSLGDTRRSLTFLERALKLNEEVGDLRGVAMSLMNMAICEVDAQRARDLTVKALELQAEIGDHINAVAARNNLARMYIEASQLEEALTQGQLALMDSENLRHASSIQRSCETLGMVFEAQGRNEDAWASYQRAVSLARSQGDRVAEAGTRIHISWLHYRRERWSESLESAQLAAEVFRDLQNNLQYIHALDRKGAAFRKLGRFSEAIVCYRIILDVARRNNDLEHEMLALRSIGALRTDSGYYVGAIESYEEIVHASKLRMNPRFEADAYRNMAYVAYVMEDFDRAIVSNLRAWGLFEDLGDQRGVVSVSLGIASVCCSLGHRYALRGAPKAAERCWDMALSFLHELKSKEADDLRQLVDVHRRDLLNKSVGR